MDNSLLELSDDTDLALSQDDLFSLLEMVDGAAGIPPLTPLDEILFSPKGWDETKKGFPNKSTTLGSRPDAEAEARDSPSRKKPKLIPTPSFEEVGQDGDQRTLHITVERNRRKQMNDNLSALRSLMPTFYVKRGDQASIIGGVVDYIKELQQVLQSLEEKKQRKIYNEVLSPRVVPSPRLVSSARPSPLSPRGSPLSPRISLPISPRTPNQTSPYKVTVQQQGYMSAPTSPYKAAMQQGCMSPTVSISSDQPYSSSSSSSSSSSLATKAEVEVKFSGPNVLLKTKSGRIHGQVVKIIEALEALSLEILHISISASDETMLNSFTIKIGIECQLSAEDLAHEIQQTFC